MRIKRKKIRHFKSRLFKCRMGDCLLYGLIINYDLRHLFLFLLGEVVEVGLAVDGAQSNQESDNS